MVSLLLWSPKASLSSAGRFSVSGTPQFPPAADWPSSRCSNLLSLSPAGPGAIRGRAPQELLQVGVTSVLGELLQVGAILVLGEPLQVGVTFGSGGRPRSG